MTGKVCLVTGATAGIGKVTALELARMGATVVMAARDRGKAEMALAEIQQATGNPNLDLLIADLSSQQSIRDLAAAFKGKYDRLHVLVN
ncbi:MAG TPA: SDR family NAD(P)-dependent oxidoreductase, partial [Symbiobacteriaceae bacterium]|nr:SDR family NAD(P)-dependent oxidoreductase [Symbiobacteriaceae bacterium]